MKKYLCVALLALCSSCLASFEIGPVHKFQKNQEKNKESINSINTSVSTMSSASSSALPMTAAECESLDQQRIILVAIGYGLGAIGTSGGVALPETTNDTAKTVEAITVGVAALGTIILNSIASQDGAKFNAKCTQ